MPRNSSGDYSLPAGNPVTTGTPIASTWANGTLSDLATAMTDSLSRSGDGGMLAALEILAGDVNSPGLTFSAETSLGLYRSGAGKLAVAVSAAKIAEFSATGLALTGLLAITGTATISSTLDVAGNFSVATNKFNVTAASGNTAIAGTLGVTGASTFAAVSGTTGTFSSTLGVTGVATFAAAVKVADGDASSPGVQFTSDVNTGFYRVASGSLGITTNGTLRLTIAGSGIVATVGISGTTLTMSSNASVGGTLGVTGVATFTAQPIRASAGGFLYNASSSNGAGTVTISNSVPGSAADVGSPGAMRFVYV